MTGRRLARFAAMFGLLAGCGGGGSSKPITESDFCAQKADAECQVTDRCGSTKDACKAERMAKCTAFASAAKASGMRFFVAANVGTCINKTTAVYAKTSAITPADTADIDDACNYVFQGDGEVNVDHCDNKYDCAGRVICDKTFCATASAPKAVDQPCGNPGDVCATGNYCAMNTAGVSVCTAKGSSGDTCSATVPCLETLRCAGTCGDRLPMNSACTSNDDCATTAPYCDPYAGNVCFSGLFFAPNSSSCADFGGPSSSGTGGTTGGSGGGTGGSGGGTGGGAGGRGGTGGSGTGGSGTGGTGPGTGGSGTGGTGGSGTGGGGGTN